MIQSGASGGEGFVLRPHPLFILLHPLGQVAAVLAATLVAVCGVLAWRWAGFGAGPRLTILLLGGATAVTGRLLWAVAQWATRVYGITGGVLWAERGVLHRRRDELATDRVQAVTVDKPVLPRLFGLGSVGFASSGTGGYEVVWYMVGRPDRWVGRARERIGRGER